MSRRLLFFFVHHDRLEIFGFDNQTAVEALHVIDPVSAGNNLGSVVIAGGG